MRLWQWKGEVLGRCDIGAFSERLLGRHATAMPHRKVFDLSGFIVVLCRVVRVAVGIAVVSLLFVGALWNVWGGVCLILVRG